MWNINNIKVKLTKNNHFQQKDPTVGNSKHHNSYTRWEKEMKNGEKEKKVIKSRTSNYSTDIEKRTWVV